MTVPCAAQLRFNFSYFDPNRHDINYTGDATTSDSVIQLTRNQKDRNMKESTGQIIYSEPLHLWDKATGSLADFSCHFTFVINSQNRDKYGDGMAFFLAPLGFHPPDVQEGSGIGLVSVNQTLNSTSNPFVAVEFDTFSNTWDPPGDHVGVNINSMESVESQTWYSSILSAQMNEAWITYNYRNNDLWVVYTGFVGNKTERQKFNVVVDLREYLPEWVIFGFSAATGDNFEIHAIHSWDFWSDLPVHENMTGEVAPSPEQETEVAPKLDQKRGSKGKVIVGLILGVLVCALVFGLGSLWFCLRKKRNRVGEKKDGRKFDVSDEFESGTGPKKFSYKELVIATKNFLEDEKVGEGGFGGVYKGFLKESGSYVAVKRVSKGSKQGVKEFASEVKIISRLRHRNLVKLIGWCHEERELLLVYDFMPNGSLDYHLFKGKSLLTWATRYNIVKGLASALLYLHEEWEQCVLHRDIKTSNIMLDSCFNAKLGDFGLARLVDHGKGAETTLLAGTMGYISPESVMTGKSSKGSDVYSFGVVALELASGRKPFDPMAKDCQTTLVDRIWGHYGNGKLVEAADPKLCEDFDEKQMECLMTVGLWCAHPDSNLRPSIKQAIQMLNFEALPPNLPSRTPVPTYSVAPMHMDAF